MDEEFVELLNRFHIGARLVRALERLLQNDRYLFSVNANERSITHKLGCYLQSEFAAWDVDCEYNRDGHGPKELNLPEYYPSDEDTDAKTVFPDVIVHRRGTNQNRLVVECKKSSNRRLRDNDFLKLREYKNQMNYDHALFIEFSVEPQPPGISYLEWVNE